MREAVIVAGARTPVGKAKKGSLAVLDLMIWEPLRLKKLRRAGDTKDQLMI